MLCLPHRVLGGKAFLVACVGVTHYSLRAAREGTRAFVCDDKALVPYLTGS